MTTKTELLEGLNDDLAGEWGTIMRYTYHLNFVQKV